MAWWSHESKEILLEHFNYNSEGWNNSERYQNVDPEDITRVENLETSLMGIGWSLKAYFGFITIFPYLIIIYLGDWLINKINKNKKEA